MTAAALAGLARASLSASVMILAALLLRLRFQDRTPRRAFCLLWDMILVRLLLPAEIPSPVSVQRWMPALSARTEVAAIAPAAMPGLAAGAERGTLQVSRTAGDALQSAARWDISRETALAGLWLAGALILAAWLLGGHLRGRRVYAASLPLRDEFVRDWLAARPLRRPVRARTSDRVASPLTYGVLYPVILLPSGMDRTDRETLGCVLAHEYQHIRRFDALRKGLLALALCLHWCNPLVWLLYVLANRDMELCCDEAAVRSGADREGYALALLGLEERRGRWSAFGSHFSQNALEERIEAIMKHKHISFTALAAVLLVMCITTTVFATAAPGETAEPDPGGDGNAPATGYVYDPLGLVVDSDVTILSKGGKGDEKLYSVDGGPWLSEEDYHARYGSWGGDWQVEWWTYEDYRLWLEEEKELLQSIIGERCYIGGEGWFIWDQERVDKAVAMYEEILENIKNGALYSKTIIDKNGNNVEDAMLGSGGAPLDMVFATAFDESEMVGVTPKELDKDALLEELKAFGVGGGENLMTWNGELVRTFVDGAPVGDNGWSIQYVYTNREGTVDLHTLRSAIYNPDGSYDAMGDLIAVVAAGDRGFDQRLIDAARVEAGPQVTTGNGSGERGTTFEEIFARYEQYGLSYQPRQGGMGSLTWNGQPVRSFADLKPDGGAFSYQDPCAREGLAVYTAYDREGNLTGLSAE